MNGSPGDLFYCNRKNFLRSRILQDKILANLFLSSYACSPLKLKALHFDHEGYGSEWRTSPVGRVLTH